MLRIPAIAGVGGAYMEDDLSMLMMTGQLRTYKENDDE